MELMFAPLRKYADFNGRARRKEYWLFQLLILLTYIVVFVLAGILGGFSSGEGSNPGGIIGGGLLMILGFGIILPSLAVTVRRLHDTEKSGWMILIGLIPLVGGLIVFVFTVMPGTQGPNRFGADPKGPASDAEIFA